MLYFYSRNKSFFDYCFEIRIFHILRLYLQVSINPLSSGHMGIQLGTPDIGVPNNITHKVPIVIAALKFNIKCSGAVILKT